MFRITEIFSFSNASRKPLFLMASPEKCRLKRLLRNSGFGFLQLNYRFMNFCKGFLDLSKLLFDLFYFFSSKTDGWLSHPFLTNRSLSTSLKRGRDRVGMSMLESRSTFSISCLRANLAFRTSSANRYENFCNRIVESIISYH